VLGDDFLHSLPLPDFLNENGYLGGGFKYVSRKEIPVTEDTLREGLSLSKSSKMGSESKRLGDRQVASH